MWPYTAISLLMLALAASDASPAERIEFYDSNDMNIPAPQKRPALVLDRLLIALQRALREEEKYVYNREDGDGPRALPLRVAGIYDHERGALQRRAHKGRVPPCYFNPITCF